MLDLSIVMILDNMDLKLNSVEEKRDNVITTNTSSQTVETEITNKITKGFFQVIIYCSTIW